MNAYKIVLDKTRLLPSPDNNNQPLSVVIVEDQFLIAEKLAKKLETAGYTIAGQVGSGEEAVELVQQSRPDIVLMDIYLSDGSIAGMTAAKKIREFGFQGLLIFTTAYKGQLLVDKAVESGADAFLVKPVQIDDLLRTIVIEHAKLQAKIEKEEQRLAELRNLRKKFFQLIVKNSDRKG